MLLSILNVRPEFLFKCFISLALLFGMADHWQVRAKDAPTTLPCKESLSFYEEKGFVVRKIRIQHLVEFLPKSAAFEEGLTAAVNSLPPERGLKPDQPFAAVKLSRLTEAIRGELESLLIGQTGIQYVFSKLEACKSDPPSPTLEVVFVVVTTARAAYVSNSFELKERDDKEEVETGNDKTAGKLLTQQFYFGYNGSRGIYAGAKSSYKINKGIVEKLDLDVSGSASSSVINTSLTGNKEFKKGPLSYAEWRLGYRFSSIPTDTVRLEDSTVAGQFFSATKPMGSRNLYFRFGGSVEGGNRHSDLSQLSAPPGALTDAGYRALKLYVGGTFSGKYYDWKSSYGIQLGNSGQGLRINYIKQIVDSAIRARFLPADHKPLQVDLQFTAGSIKSVSGAIPVGERFFGGNVAQEFIGGDTWRITSSPFIRSFPQNRLSRLDNTAPIGGVNFASFNLTIAQTVWNRQLVPTEIANSADVVSGLGGQLLSTRLFLREEQIQSSPEIKALGVTIHQLTPSINELKRTLEIIKAGEQNLPEETLSAIDSSLTTIEEVIAAAVLDPDAPKPVISNLQELAGFINNPIESNAVQLVKDFDSENLSLINGLKNSLAELRPALSESGKERIEVAARTLATRSSVISDALVKVEELRGYRSLEIGELIKIISEAPAPSGRTLPAILESIRLRLEPLRAAIKVELNNLPADSGDAAVKERRLKLNEFRDLVDNAHTYTEKSSAAVVSAQEFFEANQMPDAKFDIERLAIGFGSGLRPLLVGLRDNIVALERGLIERNEVAVWTDLNRDSEELLTFRKNIAGGFKKLRVPGAEKEANKTVGYVSRVFGTLTRELNIIGISPVFMFDATRFGTGKPLDQTGFRYGIGGGLRLSLVNIDFTGGYSVNPKRGFGEPVGAFVFKLDINDIFR